MTDIGLSITLQVIGSDKVSEPCRVPVAGSSACGSPAAAARNKIPVTAKFAAWIQPPGPDAPGQHRRSGGAFRVVWPACRRNPLARSVR